MAIRRVSFDEILSTKPKDVDYAKLDATTEEDICRYQIEDGHDPEAPVEGFRAAVLPQAVRHKTGMTQEAFAEALRIPVATLRNWEQGRFKLDPAAQSLLLIVWADPEAAFRTLKAAEPA